MTTLSPPPGFGFPRQHSPPKSQVEKPKRSMRVSWAAGENLCQVRLFVAEDAPVMSGTVQDLLQAKPTRNMHMCNPSISAPTPDAPPGFGGVPVKSQPDLLALAAIVPQISWRAPSKVHLDPTWHVMAGGASLETGLQKQREVRILEAVYPRPSSIPESPAEPVEAQEPYDDSITPQIPLVPLEEEDVSDGSDASSLSLGPRFLSQGPSAQVGGAQPMSVSNGRPEMVKQYIAESLLGQRQEISNARNDSAWGNATVGPTTRPVDHSSDVLSGRPPPARPSQAGSLPNLLTNSKQNGVQPDVAAATAAAFAALSKSQEIGSMIDNELLIRILSDPSILQSLTKPPLPNANSKPEISSGMNINGTPRLPDKINQPQVTNGVISRAANHWISPPSTSYMTTVSVGGQDGSRSRSSEPYINAGERFQRTPGPEERPPPLQPGALGSNAQLGNSQLGNNQLYTDPTNGGRVALGLPNSTDTPPGFGSSTLNANGNMPPGFANNNSASQLGAQTGASPQVGATASRPLSRLDEEYFKSLILQHGSANNDDQGRAAADKGSAGARSGNIYNAPEVKRWNGMEQIDAGRPERNGRERQDNDTGTGAETAAARPKSRKVCIYFGTARGCRNGDNCSFVHEISETSKRPQKMRSAPSQVPYAKRLKVDG
ncbi:unnamed protein product [Calypogeia fissa]